jgi:hypothetical protein
VVSRGAVRDVHRIVQSRRVLPEHHLPDDRDARDRATSLAGTVVGTIAISAVSEILRRIEEVDLGFVQVGKPGLREIALRS